MAPNIRIGILSNCFAFGYRGVDRRDTYPEVVRRRLEAERPGLRVGLVFDTLYHPAELTRQVERALAKRPDILVIDTAGNVLSANKRQAVDLGRMPAALAGLVESVRRGRSFAKGMVDRHPFVEPVVQSAEAIGALALDRARSRRVRRHAPLTLQDYERWLRAAVARVDAEASTTLVIQGPSVFNPDESDRTYQPATLDVYREVNTMVKRVAADGGAIVLDRQGVAGGAGSGIFLDGSIRLSRAGHALMGQALADMLLRSRLA